MKTMAHLVKHLNRNALVVGEVGVEGEHVELLSFRAGGHSILRDPQREGPIPSSERLAEGRPASVWSLDRSMSKSKAA